MLHTLFVLKTMTTCKGMLCSLEGFKVISRRQHKHRFWPVGGNISQPVQNASKSLTPALAAKRKKKHGT